jgi:hypothetical protein
VPGHHHTGDRESNLQSRPNKAPRDDGITNSILYKMLDILLLSLYKLFNVCFYQGYCPTHFKNTITVVL